MRRLLLIVVLLLLLVIPPFLAHSQGGRLETVQEVAFPVIIVSIFFLGGRLLRVPKWVPAIALLGWLGCVLNRETTLRTPEPYPRLTIAQVNNDPLGIQTRSLQRYGAIIAKTYDLPMPLLLSRAFRSSHVAYRWLKSRGDSRLVIMGESPALELVFGPSSVPAPCEVLELSVCSELKELAKSFDILLDQEVGVVRPRFSPVPLLMVMRPESIHFAYEPVELNAHVLIWLSEGLRLASRSGAKNLARSEDALVQAGSILGQWKSMVPVSASRAILGTIQLTTGAERSLPVYTDAVKLLYRALRLVRVDNDAELWAMIVNNIAVSKLYRDNDPQTWAEARKMLRQASSVVSRKQSPVLAARVATINLQLLDSDVFGTEKTEEE